MFRTEEEAEQYCEIMNEEYIELLVEYQDKAIAAKNPKNETEIDDSISEEDFEEKNIC